LKFEKQWEEFMLRDGGAMTSKMMSCLKGQFFRTIKPNMGPNNKLIQLCSALTVVYDLVTHSPFLNFFHRLNFL